jgi:predicted enzyme related to lactoylglutathione lyase
MKEPDSPTPYWLVYFAVDDADAAVQRATGNGGRVLFGLEDSPYGRMATLADPNGAVFGVIDTSRRAEG